MLPLQKARYYFSEGGVQEKTSVFLLKPTELQIAQNVQYYENGALTKRAGYIKRYTNPLSGLMITGLYDFIKRDLTHHFLTTSDKLYSSSQGDASAVELAGGLTFTTGSSGENLMSFITFNNKAIGTNGVEVIWQCDGTTGSVLAGSPPISKIIATFQNFVFLGGSSTYPYRLYFSNDGNETTWTATDYVDIGDLTSAITGLAVLFGKLYIFTRRAIYELTGYDRDTFTVNEVTLALGCVAHKSIVKVDNNLIFFTDRGIYSFDGVNVHYLSENMQVTQAGFNYARIAYVVGEHYKAKNQVWFSVPNASSGANNLVICMTYKPTLAESQYGISNLSYYTTAQNVAFATYTGMVFNCFGLEKSDTSLDKLYAGGYTGLVWLQDSGTNDDGVAIDFAVKLPPIDGGNPETFKRFRYMKLFVKQVGNYAVNISYKTDFRPGTDTTTYSMLQTTDASLWGSMIWGTAVWGGSSIINSRVPLRALGNHLEIIFSNNVINQEVVIKGFTILFQNKGDARYNRSTI
ncbi:conserved hypothetical protein [Azospirillaceae bacterium]